MSMPAIERSTFESEAQEDQTAQRNVLVELGSANFKSALLEALQVLHTFLTTRANGRGLRRVRYYELRMSDFCMPFLRVSWSALPFSRRVGNVSRQIREHFDGL